MRRTTIARVFAIPLPLSLFALLMLWGVSHAEPPLMDPNFVGSFEDVNCEKIFGWAADLNRLNTPITVNVFDGPTLLTSVLANNPRSDIGSAIGDNGLHGFVIEPPPILKNGLPHSVSVRFESTTFNLANSPRSFRCGSAAFTISNPKITSFEIRSQANATLPFGVNLGGNKKSIPIKGQTTTNPNLSLRVEFDRNPSFYRLGEIHDLDHPEQDLRSLPWQPYTAGQSFNFRLDTTQSYGTRYVFMQISTVASESSASPAVGDGVVLAPAHTKQFVLTGQALTQFVQRAKDLGYRFSFEGPTIQGDYPCESGTHMVPFRQGSDLITEMYVARTFSRTESYLNPFWKITSMVPGSLAALGSPQTYQITISGPTSGRADDPARVVGYKRTYGVFSGQPSNALGPGTANFNCSPGTLISSDPGFDSITLEGPDDKSPVDAFFDLRPN
jgi:hypothetical protein